MVFLILLFSFDYEVDEIYGILYYCESLVFYFELIGIGRVKKVFFMVYLLIRVIILDIMKLFVFIYILRKKNII